MDENITRALLIINYLHISDISCIFAYNKTVSYVKNNEL
jgi:hypothetical protein